jgi:hypothetical protein
MDSSLAQVAMLNFQSVGFTSSVLFSPQIAGLGHIEQFCNRVPDLTSSVLLDELLRMSV